MDHSTSGLPVPNYLPEFAQVHIHWIGDAIKPSHPLPPSSAAFNLSQLQSLFQKVDYSHQAAKFYDAYISQEKYLLVIIKYILNNYFLCLVTQTQTTTMKKPKNNNDCISNIIQFWNWVSM